MQYVDLAGQALQPWLWLETLKPGVHRIIGNTYATPVTEIRFHCQQGVGIGRHGVLVVFQ